MKPGAYAALFDRLIADLDGFIDDQPEVPEYEPAPTEPLQEFVEERVAA
jgi:hypothetical protein